jgi:hypothetical protein
MTEQSDVDDIEPTRIVSRPGPASVPFKFGPTVPQLATPPRSISELHSRFPSEAPPVRGPIEHRADARPAPPVRPPNVEAGIGSARSAQIETPTSGFQSSVASGSDSPAGAGAPAPSAATGPFPQPSALEHAAPQSGPNDAPPAPTPQPSASVTPAPLGEKAPAVEPKARHSVESSADPVVGWLVVVKGPGKGAVFSLRRGRNAIGVAADQAVVLGFGDPAIADQGHAYVVYDPETREFLAEDGKQRELVRHNGRLLSETRPIAAGDEIRIGSTALRFAPLCGPQWDWNGPEEPASVKPFLMAAERSNSNELAGPISNGGNSGREAAPAA